MDCKTNIQIKLYPLSVGADSSLRFLDGMDIYCLEGDEEKGTTLPACVSFVNNVIKAIMELASDRSKNITIISTSADGLLTEHLTHEMLNKLGYPNVKWRIIGVGNLDKNAACTDAYQYSEKGRTQFAEGKDVSYFSSVDAYLNDPLSKKDRWAIGYVIQLCIDPTRHSNEGLEQENQKIRSHVKSDLYALLLNNNCRIEKYDF